MRQASMVLRSGAALIVAFSVGACAAASTTPTNPPSGASATAPASVAASSPTAALASPAPSTATAPSPTGFPAGWQVSKIQVGEPVAPRWLTADARSVWVHEPTSLVRIDLATGAVTGTVPLNWMDYGYDTTGAGFVWQTDYENDTLVKIDPVAETVVARIPLEPGSAPEGVAVTAGSVFVADEHGGAVTRLDPKTGRVIATIPVGPPEPNGPQIMAAGPGGVWVGSQATGENLRIDAATNKVGLRVPIDGPVASDGKEVWINVDPGWDGPSSVVRIDPVTGKVITSVALDTGLGSIAVGLGSVWVTSGGLTQIDEATGRIVGRTDIDGGGNVVVAGGAIWVAADGNPYVLRITPP
jgi:streptogramin lyase